VAGGSSVDDSANLCKIALLSVGLGGSDGIASASTGCSLVVGYGGRSEKQEDHAAVRPACAWHESERGGRWRWRWRGRGRNLESGVSKLAMID
jgi:hypothetical protein